MINRNLSKAIDRFDLETYVEETFTIQRRVLSNQSEIHVNCFAPNGCAGSDYKQHLYINVETKRWYCHKCGFGNSQEQPGTNSLVHFLSVLEGVPPVVIVERLLDTVEPTTDEDLYETLIRMFYEDPEPDPEPRILDLPRTVQPLRARGITSAKYYKYITERGFSLADLESLDVRFVVKHPFPRREGQKREFAWKWRVVFPIYDLEGRCRSAVGRSITDKQEFNWAAWPEHDTRDLLWPLGHWKLDKWVPISDVSTLVLTEGVPDAHAVNRLTSFRSLCTFGKKISEPQMDLISQIGIKKIILAWDRDAKVQIRRAVKKLSTRFEVAVFPFLSKGWHEFDFGDVLAGRMNDQKQATQLMVEELNNSISAESPEYCAWVID